MPLRDHFHPPLTKHLPYQSIHSLWPSMMLLRLNEILPQRYYCGLNVNLGGAMEVDVGTLETTFSDDSTDNGKGGTALAWQPEPATLLLDTEEWDPPEYEVLVYDGDNYRKLVAAVELVSPGNKDRPQNRETFVAKCHTLLHRGVCVAIVDPVTERSGNLYAELAERLGAERPAIASTSIYAVSCRAANGGRRTRIEAWPHELAMGSPLPTLPLWLSDTFKVPLELERTYEETCKGLRIR